MHFSHSTNESQRGDDDYNRLFKVHQKMVLSNFAVYLDKAVKNRCRIHDLGYDVVMKMTDFF